MEHPASPFDSCKSSEPQGVSSLQLKKLVLKRLGLEFSYPTKPVLFSLDYNVEELAKETKKVIIEGKI